jgi:hypothetical protein
VLGCGSPTPRDTEGGDDRRGCGEAARTQTGPEDPVHPCLDCASVNLPRSGSCATLYLRLPVMSEHGAPRCRSNVQAADPRKPPYPRDPRSSVATGSRSRLSPPPAEGSTPMSRRAQTGSRLVIAFAGRVARRRQGKPITTPGRTRAPSGMGARIGCTKSALASRRTEAMTVRRPSSRSPHSQAQLFRRREPIAATRARCPSSVRVLGWPTRVERCW